MQIRLSCLPAEIAHHYLPAQPRRRTCLIGLLLISIVLPLQVQEYLLVWFHADSHQSLKAIQFDTMDIL